MNKPGTGIKVVSFFSGGGGLDLGFSDVGYEIIFANDNVEVFCDTLRANKGRFYPEFTQVECEDIRQLPKSKLPSKVDLVIGGPPCQTFSASGRRAGGAPGRLDSRGTLFEAYCQIVRLLKPKAFLFENVRGILGTHKGKDWQEIVKAFSDIGYRISHRILDACDYGIPQQRERLFLVGHTMDCEFLFPKPTHGSDSASGNPHVTPEEAFKDLPQCEDLDALTLDGGKYSHLLPLVPWGQNYLFFTAKRGYPKPIFAYRSRFSDFLYKANPNHPIKTLIASPGKYTGPFHWDNRRFSIAEYKRLQGFPDNYVFCGKRSDVIKQIGNSVSPNIARALALAMAKQIFQRDINIELLPSDQRLSFDKRKGIRALHTKKHHINVSRLRKAQFTSAFDFTDYSTQIQPFLGQNGEPNVTAVADGNFINLVVNGDHSGRLFAQMTLEISAGQLLLFGNRSDLEATVNVTLYGEQPHSIQSMWNAVDDLVIRSSSFHSLFELYGHFTEPHPIFRITRFCIFSSHPIAQFAQHVSDFSNCSRYFDRKHLTRMFGRIFGTQSFTELVEILRKFRFDIRCHETNVAIPPDRYMVAYPFTLPIRKQMNFSVKNVRSATT